MNKKEIKKNKHTKIIIIIILVIAVIGIGGYFGYKYYKDHQSVGTSWGDTYYAFIKDSKEKNKKNKIKDNSKIEFIDVPDFKEPIMVVDYKKSKKDYSDIYYINEGEVKNVLDLESSNVEMLYNMEDKKYNWYVHKTNDNEEVFTPVVNIINKGENKEYTIKKDEEISVDTVDGSKMTMSKFDSIFIKPDIDIDQIKYNDSLKDNDLKESMTDNIKDYKTTKEIEKEVSKDVSKQETEINTKKDEMSKAEEEVKKKQEEEARKKAEEEAKGLKIGSYHAKYGKYYAYVGGTGEELNDYFIINKDGTGTLYYGNTGSGPSTETGTYKVGKYSFAQSVSDTSLHDGIGFFDSNNQLISRYAITSDDTFSDGDVILYKLK